MQIFSRLGRSTPAPTTPARRLYAPHSSIAMHLIKGTPPARPVHIDPKADHISFEVGDGNVAHAAATALQQEGAPLSNLQELSCRCATGCCLGIGCCRVVNASGSLRDLTPCSRLPRMQTDNLDDVEQMLVARGMNYFKQSIIEEDGVRVSQVCDGPTCAMPACQGFTRHPASARVCVQVAFCGDVTVLEGLGLAWYRTYGTPVHGCTARTNWVQQRIQSNLTATAHHLLL